jgi:MFS family permease
MLVVARFFQGAAAAAMMPASLALIGEAYPAARERRQAVATWAIGGAVASSAGPLLGGVLTLLSWRTIFFINVPVGLIALLMLAKAPRSTEQPAQLDLPGQLAAVVAMGGLTFAAIRAGSVGLGSRLVVASFAVAVISAVVFIVIESRVRAPMVPLPLLRLPAVRLSAVLGFTFMVGFYGLPFVVSLYFQQARGLSALQTGALFLPMFVFGFLSPFSARIAERVGTRTTITTGLLSMTVGLAAIGLVLSSSVSIGLVSGLMALVGLGGPLVMPMTTAHLLHHVSPTQAGTASGVFNTSRQLGGALAVAVFGSLLANPHTFIHGARLSLFIAAGLVLSATFASLALEQPPRQPADDT